MNRIENLAAIGASIFTSTVVLGAALFPAVSSAAEPERYPGVTLAPISALQAAQIKSDLKERALFVDVRSRAAVHIGMPAGIDAHVPFSEPSPGYGWTHASNQNESQINLAFGNDFNEALLSHGLDFGDPVVLISADGAQALQASELLAEIGYTQIFVATDGVTGAIAMGTGAFDVSGVAPSLYGAGVAPWAMPTMAAAAKR
jgi:rhodanese-related sulfurtransferase